MVGAQYPLLIGEGLLVQCDRLGRAARQPVVVGEVVARSQGLGMVGAQHPLSVGQGLLVQRDRLSYPTRIPVGEGEVIARLSGSRDGPVPSTRSQVGQVLLVQA